MVFLPTSTLLAGRRGLGRWLGCKNQQSAWMKSVFLVDDSATMLMRLKGTLEISGFKVDTVPDGRAALNKLKAGFKPDLIITAINMPKLDGIGLIREARTLLRFTPILALTTESHSRVDKPVDAADLVKVIKQVLPGA